MATHPIRVFGDPVLRQRASEVENLDGSLARLAGDMVETMYEAEGVGLAAPQVGVQRRIFVFDVGEGPLVVVNPRIDERHGEVVDIEGCLSVPGLSWEIARAAEVHLTGYDVEGNEISLDGNDRLARVFQHELDHLDGVLLLERLDADQRKEAMKALRARVLDVSGGDPAPAPPRG